MHAPQILGADTGREEDRGTLPPEGVLCATEWATINQRKRTKLDVKRRLAECGSIRDMKSV
jgi:hypothetical protein